MGFAGAVYPWLDYELIEFAARSMSDLNFVFIGPIRPRISRTVQRLKYQPNLHFLGFKLYHRVPHYLHHFDIGIIPFQKKS